MKEAFDLYNNEIDMVVSVSEFPFYHFYEERSGYLFPYGASYSRRQDAPKFYRHNGSLYIINTNSITKYNSFEEFTKNRKYLMAPNYSIDIDNTFDWERVESALENENSRSK